MTTGLNRSFDLVHALYSYSKGLDIFIERSESRDIWGRPFMTFREDFLRAFTKRIQLPIPIEIVEKIVGYIIPMEKIQRFIGHGVSVTFSHAALNRFAGQSYYGVLIRICMMVVHGQLYLVESPYSIRFYSDRRFYYGRKPIGVLESRRFMIV